MPTSTKRPHRPLTKRQGGRSQAVPNQSVDNERLLTLEQVATFLALSPKTVQNWRYDKTRRFDGPPYRSIGGAIRYSERELLEWLACLPVSGWNA